MRTLRRWMCASLLLSLLAACGGGAATPTLEPIPTITPLGDETPTAGAGGDETPEPAGGDGTAAPDTGAADADLQQGKELMEAGNYEEAVEFINPVYNADTQNVEAATLLAQAYDEWGMSILKANPTSLEAVREAFDKFNLAEDIKEASGDMKDTAAKHKQASEAMLKGMSALDQFDTMMKGDKDPVALQGQVEIAMDSVKTIKEVDDSFSGLREFNYQTLLAAADAKAMSADAQDGREARLPLWEEAKDLCTEAKNLWPDDEVAAADAIECIEEMENNITPKATPTPSATPTPKITPTPKPAAPPPPPPGPKKIRFAPVIQVGFQAGDQTGGTSSCVTGRVILANGTPVAAAVGNVNNGGSSIEWVSDGGGNFGVCGLGWSNWSAVLYYIPASYGELAGTVAIPGLWLNGSGDQRAVVVFKGQ